MNQVIVDSALNSGPCPICEAQGQRYLRRGYYLKCSVCKAAFREQQESVAELDEYWQKGFWTEEEIQKRKNREPVFRHALKVVEHHKPDGISVLDIGCGIGTFLAVCRDAGWEVTGVEPSTTACEVARREYGIEPVNELFASRLFPGRTFDAIFAAQVLHHLPDPVAFITDVDRVLADDGVLVLRTPNLITLEMSLFVQRLLGRKREFFCGPALYAFHPTTLSLLFRRLEYEEVTFVNSRPYLEMPGAPWRSGRSPAAGLAGELRRLLVVMVKSATYGLVQLAHALSRGRVVLGPSIFVVARKKRGAPH